MTTATLPSTTETGFAPTGLLANSHVQSTLASAKLRRRLVIRRLPGMEQTRRRLTLDCGDGVRLYAHYSPQPGDPAGRGLVVLIHGWEGCHDSIYLSCIGAKLWQAGYAVLRLNLRDHGGSHHLNRLPFAGSNLTDPLGALHHIARHIPGGDHPFLIGFSMGGNFALRLAAAAPEAGLKLRATLAVSPALNPSHTTAAIDQAPRMYRWYFWRKWRKSLAAKAAAWPDLGSLDALANAPSLTEATNRFAPRFTEYPDAATYWSQYTIGRDALAGVDHPLHILTAADDPVIPVADFERLNLPSHATLQIERFGGHCGFVRNWRFDCLHEDIALSWFASLG